MSLLDDAREYRDDLADGTDALHGCGYCGGEVSETGEYTHVVDCLAVLMNRVVAALEAAEAVLWAVDEDEWHGDALSRSLRKATQDLEIAMDDGTDDEAFLAALKEEVVP